MQGKTFEEIKTLPQVIATNSTLARKRATKLFKKVTNKFVYCKPKVAEFSKVIFKCLSLHTIWYCKSILYAFRKCW